MSINLQLGRTIKGRYKLIDERGSGSFGEVYIVRDLQTNYLYAAKIMYQDHTSDNELLERFKREAYILQSLNDQHIVRIVDFGNDDNLYFIIMHHIDGQNLKYYITTYGPIEPLRAIHYILQAAQGLDAAHKIGVVHRDIKPQNILINNKGVVKIVDFGLSRSKESPTITTSDKFMGTAYYTAPEQVMSSHSADIRSDLYSLAVVLFEALTGYPPYTGGTVVDIILKHQTEAVPSVCKIYPNLPYELDAFMQKAMAKHPDDRFQTPREFIHALEQIQQRMHGPVPAVPQAHLIINTTGQTFVLAGTKLIIGREDPKREIHPDIQINDQTMTLGRVHARFLNEEGKWMVEDQNSRNKTRLNGRILHPYEAMPLKDGDLLHFGRVEARFELH
ncbi:MAG TPA: FHA domain-containing serine/threonine-protein kinase [Ktedonobacteraceae bacterium]|nr:FHA domain-containing serine/threonine-protein kinase [Ktedonobacteraceae bacterium]